MDIYFCILELPAWSLSSEQNVELFVRAVLVIMLSPVIASYIFVNSLSSLVV